MLRYDAKMLGPDIRNPYGSVQLSPLAQASYLREAGHPLLAQWLMDGLITVKKSARLVDDLELRKVLRENSNGR
jgi:hypothetical protein